MYLSHIPIYRPFYRIRHHPTGNFKEKDPFEYFGPSSILPCIQGKLKGYTWNLIENYPTQLHVFAYYGRYITDVIFAAKNKFRKKTISRYQSDSVLLMTPMFTVQAVKLDHRIPCLAFSLEEAFHISIDKALLIRKGLSVGPWLNDFKKVIR